MNFMVASNEQCMLVERQMTSENIELVDIKVKFVNCFCQRHPSGEMSDYGHCNACVRVSDYVML